MAVRNEGILRQLANAVELNRYYKGINVLVGERAFRSLPDKVSPLFFVLAAHSAVDAASAARDAQVLG